MRSYLENLKHPSFEPFVILGHDQIDVDSVISGLLLERLCRYLELEATFVILDSVIPADTVDLLKCLNLNPYDYQSSSLPHPLAFLVDHWETTHSNQIIGCLDHHPNSIACPYPFYQNQDSGACARLVYEALASFPALDTVEVKRWVALAIMVDTCSLKSTKTQPKDRQLIEAWTAAGVIDFETFYQAGLGLTNLTQPLETLYLNGLKQHSSPKGLIGSSYLQVSKPLNPDLQTQLLKAIQLKLAKEDWFAWVFLVANMETEETFEFRIFKAGREDDPIQGTHYPFIASRGQTVMPRFLKELETPVCTCHALCEWCQHFEGILTKEQEELEGFCTHWNCAMDCDMHCDHFKCRDCAPLVTPA